MHDHFDLFSPPPPRPWYQKIPQFIFGGFILLVFLLIAATLAKRKRKHTALKTRLKYFNPVIRQRWYGRSVDWVGRSRALSEAELEALLNDNKTPADEP